MDIAVTSAWGIVVDKRTMEIQIQTKLHNNELIAILKKTANKITGLSDKDAIIIHKWWFTKGKVEKGEEIEQTIFREIEEEWWIPKEYLKFIKDVWSFTKKKDYGYKEVKMRIYELLEDRHLVADKKKLQPTDKRHIATFFPLHEIEWAMKSEEERKFFRTIKHEIINLSSEDLEKQ